MVNFFERYELPFHQGKFITAMSQKVDSSFATTTLVTPQKLKLSHIFFCV